MKRTLNNATVFEDERRLRAGAIAEPTRGTGVAQPDDPQRFALGHRGRIRGLPFVAGGECREWWQRVRRALGCAARPFDAGHRGCQSWQSEHERGQNDGDSRIYPVAAKGTNAGEGRAGEEWRDPRQTRHPDRRQTVSDLAQLDRELSPTHRDREREREAARARRTARR